MEFLRFLVRLWTLQLGYENGPIHLSTGTLSYECDASQCIYAFVSLSSANEITGAVDMNDAAVFAGDIPPQGYEVKCRLKSIEFTAITGTVLVYVKDIRDN